MNKDIKAIFESQSKEIQQIRDEKERLKDKYEDEIYKIGDLVDGLRSEDIVVIASATEEQQMVSTEIQQNVGALMNIGQQSADGAQHTQATASELAKYRDQLQGLMKQFKIS